MTKNNFIKCGICGCFLEIIWTSIEGIKNKDFKLKGTTSIWMFPIYGMACLIKPISKDLKKHKISTTERGGIYTIGIYIVEYCTGCLLKKKKCCPWDYKKAKFNIKGIIRLDYAPLWFLTGLLMEKIVSKEKSK